jgi:Spy/CpxP family protein refolding chaperone
MRKTSVQLLTSFVVFAGLVAQAQRPRHIPDPAQMIQHRVDFLTSQLGLSPTQQEQATTIFTNEMTSAKSQRDQMKAAHEGLATAIKNNDSAGIEQAAQTIGSLTSQRVSSHAKAEAAFYQILSPDQQNKYGQIHQHRPVERGFGGPAGSRPF